MSERELEELYVALEKPIYNVVYRWVWNAEDARDIVQEAFVRLWRVRDRVETGTARALAFRVALNLAASRRRRKKLWRWLPLDAVRWTATAKTDDLVQDERHERLQRAIESLPDPLRRVIVLCELAEMSYDEVGATLGIPAGTVGSRKHRALRLLREALSEKADDE
jgi:RNA polymerase sigma-70 factor (ECF subfamily)